MNWLALFAWHPWAFTIYSPKADHPWNEVHRLFYTHTFSNGEVYEHSSALDPAWLTWSRFYNDAPFFARVVAILDRFLEQPASEVERQSPVRRAILLRELWPVFDAHTNLDLATSVTARQRQATIRRKLAQLMRRLELTEVELNGLPDSIARAAEKQLWPSDFDAARPDSPFLPTDFFDEIGPWVAFSYRRDKLGAQSHLEHARFRSIFLPLIRVSADRASTREFLRQSSTGRGKVAPPAGTILALVRLAVLPVANGSLSKTSLVESVQLIIVDRPDDRRFKFVLDRQDLMAGGSGLRALTDKDSVDAYGFEASGLYPQVPEYDEDGEMLILGRYAGPPAQATRSLEHCVACHGRTVGTRLFANSSRNGRAEESNVDLQIRMILKQKANEFSWGLYQTLRASTD